MVEAKMKTRGQNIFDQNHEISSMTLEVHKVSNNIEQSPEPKTQQKKTTMQWLEKRSFKLQTMHCDYCHRGWRRAKLEDGKH